MSSLSWSETSPSWCTRGVMSMFTPTSLYSKEVMGCCGRPPVAMAAKVVTGTGTRLDPLRLQARADLDPLLLQLAPVDLQDLDLDHDLGPPLVDHVHDPLRGRHLVGGVVDGEGVAARDRGHPPRPEDDPQEVD